MKELDQNLYWSQGYEPPLMSQFIFIWLWITKKVFFKLGSNFIECLKWEKVPEVRAATGKLVMESHFPLISLILLLSVGYIKYLISWWSQESYSSSNSLSLPCSYLQKRDEIFILTSPEEVPKFIPIESPWVTLPALKVSLWSTFKGRKEWNVWSLP